MAETLDVTDDIATFLKGRFPALAARGVTDATPLISSGAIDSLGILDLVAFLGERFGIELNDEDFDPDNFETVGTLAAFVERQRA
jgi:acyl carrier protein